MDTPKAKTEIAPEINTLDEQSVTVGIESTPVAETIQPSTPPAVAQPVSDDASNMVDPVSSDSAPVDDKVTPEEVADLSSSDILPADDNWVGRVKQVIKEDAGQPYNEEEDAEKLNEDYMKSRFNVDVDAPIEEKN